MSYKRGRLYAEGSNSLDWSPNIELHPFSENEFYMAGALLKFGFRRDDGGHVLKLITCGSAAELAE